MQASRRAFVAATVLSAAPGVELSPSDDIKRAIDNSKGRTTVLDVRGVDEIVANGYFQPPKGVRWIHAQCTLEGCPLLEVAAEALIPDKEAPVVVNCASGKRSTVAKQVLESKGYKCVLNAGGYPGDFGEFL